MNRASPLPHPAPGLGLTAAASQPRGHEGLVWRRSDRRNNTGGRVGERAGTDLVKKGMG